MATPFQEAVKRQAEKRQAIQGESIRQPSIGDITKQLAAVFIGPYFGKEIGEGIGGTLFGKDKEKGILSGLGEDISNIGKGMKQDIGGIGGSIRDRLGLGGGRISAPLAASAPVSTSTLGKLSIPGLATDYGNVFDIDQPFALPGGLEDIAGQELSLSPDILDPRDIGINPPMAAQMGPDAVTPGSFGSLSTLGQLLSIAGSVKGAYDIFKGIGSGDAGGGALSGTELALASYPFLGPWSLAAIPIGSLLGGIKTGKTNKGTLQRDALRKFIYEQGFSPELGYLSTPGGGKFAITQEGGGKGAYNLNWENPLVPEAVGLLNPLGEAATEGDPNLSSQMTSMFTNAALQGATDRDSMLANVRYQYQAAGVTREEAERAIKQLAQANRITPNEYAAYLNAINTVFSV